MTATGSLAYHFIARHGYAIERLKRDMSREPPETDLCQFLAYDVANFAYAFLLASGNDASAIDRSLRDALQKAILQVLARHDIDGASIVVEPERKHFSGPRGSIP